MYIHYFNFLTITIIVSAYYYYDFSSTGWFRKIIQLVSSRLTLHMVIVMIYNSNRFYPLTEHVTYFQYATNNIYVKMFIAHDLLTKHVVTFTRAHSSSGLSGQP